MKEYKQRLDTRVARKNRQLPGYIKQYFRIYFPSRGTVDESRGGEDVGTEPIISSRSVRGANTRDRLPEPYAFKRSGGARRDFQLSSFEIVSTIKRDSSCIVKSSWLVPSRALEGRTLREVGCMLEALTSLKAPGTF